MGARYLFALDLIAPSAPPKKDSQRDVDLVRAANLALRRQHADIEDHFLFLVYGACDEETVAHSVRAYGFPNCEVRFVGEDEDLTPTADDSIALSGEYGEEIGYALEQWVDKAHPGALPLGSILAPDHSALAAYREIEWWWIGCEGTDSERPWPFDPDQLGALLPATHTSRAGTWLEILALGLALEDADLEEQPYDRFMVVAKVAALCEWLHGFEAASGNSYNHFEPEEAVARLAMSPLFIGYEAGKVLPDSERSLPEEAETDEEALRSAVLAVTAQARSGVLSALGVFGGDGLLFWTLHASIWPRYDCRLSEAMENVLGLSSVDYGEIAAPWQFVYDGWHESAEGDY
ncbi:hypothetical protein [Thiorhodococcus minor]|uniref:Uncharacterized protein n=1 Tax=Thiorhodococcus minor TaxID=57489 RepID=A0A6M0JY15_9GAMM|nr:hypothetical protein [Thiorhodococcus minor]NEV61533.1 hypothetical protein [Thiorhodococcus minor]